MGRWAHSLFGHDAAIGLAIQIIKNLAQGDDRHFAIMLAKILTACPTAVAGFYLKDYSILDQLQGDLEEPMKLMLQKLESGMCEKLFEKYRASEQHENSGSHISEYVRVILAALMMEHGITIKEAHVDNLREIVPKMQCHETKADVSIDTGFRGPGKRQFLAALDHYQAGDLRSFQEPSCHCCGKINADIKAEGKTLVKCGGCKNQIAAAWFCDKDCQRAEWERHEPNCGAPAGSETAMFQAYGKATLGVLLYKGFEV